MELPGGKRLKILSFADDHIILTQTTQASLDACAGVITEYELISGLEMSWEKAFATCTGALPPDTLPGLLSHVHILRQGESKKYLGAGYGPGVEDLMIGAQLLEKLAKKCGQLQSPFHSLAAGVVIVNSVLMRQLWFYLAIWVPSAAEYAELETIRGFFWGKTVEGTYWSAQVAWDQVVQPKDQGGLGVIDPLAKAKTLHGMWVMRTLAPGREPWKEWFLERLQHASPIAGGPGAMAWCNDLVQWPGCFVPNPSGGESALSQSSGREYGKAGNASESTCD